MTFSMPAASAGFDVRAGWLVQNLAGELQLTYNQAAAIVGNIGFESGELEDLQERAPLIPGSRGGYGWAQWTGPRRVAYESWCAANRLSPAADQANYGFLVTELRTTQAHSLEALKRTTTLEAGVFTFGYYFEHPGGTTSKFLPGFAKRLAYAQRAVAAAQHLPAPDQVASVPTAPPVATTVAAAINRIAQSVIDYLTDSEDIGPAQIALLGLGYEIHVDGVQGSETTGALNEFQADNKLPATGKADPATIAAIANELAKS